MRMPMYQHIKTMLQVLTRNPVMQSCLDGQRMSVSDIQGFFLDGAGTSPPQTRRQFLQPGVGEIADAEANQGMANHPTKNLITTVIRTEQITMGEQDIFGTQAQGTGSGIGRRPKDASRVLLKAKSRLPTIT